MIRDRLILAALFCAAPVAHGESASRHAEQNAVYRHLLEQGVSAGEQTKRLPRPTLADGLSADEQQAVVARLGGRRYPFAKLTRKSSVAPQIIRVSDLPAGNAQRPLRTVDFWFVVYSDLEALAEQQVLGKLLNSDGAWGEATALEAKHLTARGIDAAGLASGREGWGHVACDVLDRVRLRATGTSAWSRTDDSLVAAAMVDPRFASDAEFPNQWRPLDRKGGELVPGDAAAYEGLGFYVKLTRLRSPQGALLAEFHLVFAEPEGWFRGSNQLGAKLPAIIQAQVRHTRRELMR